MTWCRHVEASWLGVLLKYEVSNDPWLSVKQLWGKNELFSFHWSLKANYLECTIWAQCKVEWHYVECTSLPRPNSLLYLHQVVLTLLLDIRYQPPKYARLKKNNNNQHPYNINKQKQQKCWKISYHAMLKTPSKFCWKPFSSFCVILLAKENKKMTIQPRKYIDMQ